MRNAVPGRLAAGPADATVRNARNAVYVVFISFGFASAAWAAQIPQVRSALQVTPGVLGLILLSSAIGPAVAIPLTGLAIQRFGEALVVAASGVIAAAGLAVVAVGYRHGIAPTAAGLFVYGFGSGSGDVAMNVQGTVVERALGRAILPKFHAGWSIGTVAGAGVGTIMVAWHVPVTADLLGTAVLVGLIIVAATRGFMTLAPEPEPEPEPGPGPGPAGSAGASPAARAAARSPLAAWTELRTLLVGLFVLCMTVIEGIGNSWLSLGVISGYHATAVLGTATLSIFLAAMTAGRWFGPGIIDRHGRVRVLQAGAVIALAGLLLIGFGGVLAVAIAGAALMGLGIALGFPVGMSAAADDPRYAAGRVSTAASLGYTAFLAGPPAIGALADHLGILHALALASVLLVAALFLSRATAPIRGPVRKPELPLDTAG
jgi:MFS family permease